MQAYKKQQHPRNNYSGYENRKPRQQDNNPKPSGVQVFVREGEDISKVLRKLKKKVERAGIIKDLRDKQYYQKPSEKKRLAKKAGIARWKKKQREDALNR